MDETKILEFMIENLSSFPEIRKIVLFGSRARGMATSDSDYDLCLIVEDVTDIRMLYVRLMKKIASPDWSIDLVIMTSDQYQKGLREGWSTLAAVEREGRVLYAA